MSGILGQILTRKRLEVEAFKHTIVAEQSHPILQILKGVIASPRRGDFLAALRKEEMGIIAEVKRKSPSKGDIRDIPDPIQLAKMYEKSGANAISVLTDEEGFGGHIEDLRAVAKFVSVPVLRKDFVVDPIQIAEAVHAGASAVLLIVAALQEETEEFLDYAHQMGIDALVEVHNREELEIAIEAGAQMIGVNNRNLKTFQVDLGISEELGPLIPEHVIAISESGISTPEDVRKMKKAGFDAFLIGESLLQAEHPGQLIEELKRA